MGVLIGIAGIGFGAIGLFLLLHRMPDLAAPAVVAVPAFILAALSFAMIPISTGGTLWADAQWVGVSRPGLKAKCRRDELGSLQLGHYVYRAGTPCSFVRKDRSVAFSFYLEPWTTSQIAALAEYLGVPLTNAKDRLRIQRGPRPAPLRGLASRVGPRRYEMVGGSGRALGADRLESGQAARSTDWQLGRRRRALDAKSRPDGTGCNR